MLVAVLIPIYKDSLTASEEQSFLQCLKVLGHYPLRIVLPDGLTTAYYEKLLHDNQIADFCFDYFDKAFFKNVNAYSRLLLSEAFYQHYVDFEYIFIYQLDGYVFKDKLKDWCSKGYEYIGAPWFTSYGIHKQGNDLYRVGNGGMSLRKVTAFRSRFDKEMPLSIYVFMIKNIRKKGLIKMSLQTIKLFFVLLFGKITVAEFIRQYLDERINEDCFWADGLSDTSLGLHKPEILEAARFCLEKSPAYLYDLIGKELPFACHAYEKYEYETFWQAFIAGKV